jgi:hypothetical protein
MKTIRLAPLALAAVALAGCGGGGKSASEQKDVPNGGGGVNGISVSNCLINEDFIVQPSQTTIDGTSPGGVVFALIFLKDEAAAKAAFAKRNPKTTALVENALVDFKGNPSPYEGAPPAKISQKELAVIKRCIDRNKTAS